MEVTCPYCGEPGEVSVEADDEFVQDCAVCCRPWHVTVRLRPDGSAEVSVRAESD